MMTKQTDAGSPILEEEGAENGNATQNDARVDDTATPDPEVVVRPQRRRFTAEYKEQIIRAVDACKHGEVGTFLRHEGLTSSIVSRWRRQRDLAILTALEGKKPGPVGSEPDPRDERIAELERKLERTEKELGKAKTIIEVQKKVSELLAQGLSDESGETS